MKKDSNFVFTSRTGFFSLGVDGRSDKVIRVPKSIRVYESKSFLDDPQPKIVHKLVKKAWKDSSI
jgi:hypothetical protein